MKDNGRDNKIEDEFITTDFGLATFLFINGLRYTVNKSNPRRVVFIFSEKKRAVELMGEWIGAREVLKQELPNVK